MSNQCQTNLLNHDRVEVLYEDKTYGEYVTQRLKNIKNPEVKLYIKLEIDKIFYSIMKKFLSENISY